MTEIEQKARQARDKITLNDWLDRLCAALMIASGVFAGVTLVSRLFDAKVPLAMVGFGLAFVAVTVSVVLALVRRVDVATAATMLDEAAGLKERVSSGLMCAAKHDKDPFGQAVIADARRIATNLQVARHIGLRSPRRLGHACVGLLVAACAFLVPNGLLADEQPEPEAAAVQTAEVIRQRTDIIKKKARTNAALKPLADELEKLGEIPEDRRLTPDQLRQIALRKLDKMKDTLQQQRGEEKFRNVEQFKRMLRALKSPTSPKSIVGKLSEALAKGNFKAAAEQVNALKKQLAALAAKGDNEQIQKLQKQLEQMSKQLESLAADQKLTQTLRQAGIKKEDIQRMMKNLTPQDLKKLREQLQKKGLKQEQIEKIAKKLQQRSGANSLAGKLAQSLRQAAGAAGAGQGGQAAGALSMAAQQLSEMEALEQEMGELEATMAELQNAMGDIGNSCSQCNGTGMQNGQSCSTCNGSGSSSGSGTGGRGRGRGGIAREQRSRSAFVKRKEKVKTTRGAIIGRTLVEGQQIKGSDSSSVRDVITAAERDATDSINRARIPRRYHKSIKEYFSGLRRQYGITEPTESSESSDSSDSKPSAQSDNQDQDKE